MLSAAKPAKDSAAFRADSENACGVVAYMLRAPVMCCCAGIGTDRELPTPSSLATCTNCGHRLSEFASTIVAVCPNSAAYRHGPQPDAYCHSSIWTATSPVLAAVPGPSSIRVRETS